MFKELKVFLVYLKEKVIFCFKCVFCKETILHSPDYFASFFILNIITFLLFVHLIFGGTLSGFFRDFFFGFSYNYLKINQHQETSLEKKKLRIVTKKVKGEEAVLYKGKLLPKNFFKKIIEIESLIDPITGTLSPSDKKHYDAIMSIPFYKETVTNDNPKLVRRYLDETHYGMEEPKDNVCEWVAVNNQISMAEASGMEIKNKYSQKMCFDSSPGMGKTTFAKSLANATGRKFCKISLGGANDASLLKGNSKVYVNAGPGAIVKALIEAGSMNPVILLDEVDKASACIFQVLLEILDNAQNKLFRDNYIDDYIDISRVIFILTTNNVQNLPPELRDRVKVIHFSPYTSDNKRIILINHSIPNALKSCGLKVGDIRFENDAIDLLIERSSETDGMRLLESRIFELISHAILICNNDLRKIRKTVIRKEDVKRFYNFFEELSQTPREQFSFKDAVGETFSAAIENKRGRLLKTKAFVVPGGTGKVKVFGIARDNNNSVNNSNSEFCQEQAEKSINFLKMNAERLGISESVFKNCDFFVEKGFYIMGPSDGLAVTLAFFSYLKGIPIRGDAIAIGTMDQSGLGIPVSAILDKTKAVIDSGKIKHIIMQKDCYEMVKSKIPKKDLEKVHFYSVKTFDEVAKLMLKG